MVSKDLYINQKVSGVEIALLEDKQLTEYHTETDNLQFKVGEFYLGRVKKIIPAMNATFVDIGYEKDGFLHFTDLSPNIYSILKFTKELTEGRTVDFSTFVNEPDSYKQGRIEDILKSKPYILVQIAKEPISNKGPRLTCEFSLSGRNVVLTPFSSNINISKKILKFEERNRLLKIGESLREKNFGLIVRTAAENKGVEEINQDIKELLDLWNNVISNLHNAVPPLKVGREISKINSLLRDLLSDQFNSIVVNNLVLEKEIRNFLINKAPDQLSILKSVKPEISIFDTFNITKQIKHLFGQNVYMSSGVYLIIEKTEALHVIDVNSGTKANSKTQEENALQSNLEAVVEIARQIRLRDLGGIIIIDFIDMKLSENKKQVLDKMIEIMSLDRVRHQILPLSKFSVMQITRQRMRPEIGLDVQEVCPSCKGNGKIAPLTNIADEIQASLKYVFECKRDKISLVVHPIIKDYVLYGFISRRFLWFLKYKTWIRVEADVSIPFNSYIILEANGEEIIHK